MYTFDFQYANKSNKLFEHISKVVYSDVIEEHIIENEEILTYRFPISHDMHLYSEKSNYSVSSIGLKSISIFKED